MDARLAELYGTNQPDEADLEKLAAAEFADGLAEDGEIDLDNVDEETLEQLAQEVLGGEEEDEDEGTEKVAEGEEGEEVEEPSEEPTEDEQEKVAEADHLGRVMAHAYVQELRGIEKEAGLKEFGGKVGKFFSRGAKKALHHTKHPVQHAKALGRHAKRRYSEAGRMTREAFTGKGSLGTGEMTAKDRAKAAWGAAKKVKQEAGAAVVAGGGGTALAMRKKKDRGGKRKAASATPALDTLAVQRAQEILAENGVGEQPQQTAPDSAYDALAQEVEARAIRMLEAEGYELQE